MEDHGSNVEDRGAHQSSPLDPLDLRRLDGARGREGSLISRRIVAACSVKDIQGLAPEIRHRLRDSLSLGFAPVKEREALDKILTAELLEKIPAPELIMVEFRRGIIVKGDKNFVDKTWESLEEIACVPMGEGLLGSIASRGLTVTVV